MLQSTAFGCWTAFESYFNKLLKYWGKTIPSFTSAEALSTAHMMWCCIPPVWFKIPLCCSHFFKCIDSTEKHGKIYFAFVGTLAAFVPFHHVHWYVDKHLAESIGIKITIESSLFLVLWMYMDISAENGHNCSLLLIFGKEMYKKIWSSKGMPEILTTHFILRMCRSLLLPKMQ